MGLLLWTCRLRSHEFDFGLDLEVLRSHSVMRPAIYSPRLLRATDHIHESIPHWEIFGDSYDLPNTQIWRLTIIISNREMLFCVLLHPCLVVSTPGIGYYYLELQYTGCTESNYWVCEYKAICMTPSIAVFGKPPEDFYLSLSILHRTSALACESP